MKKVQILGTGCPKCRKLTEHAQEAIAGLGGGFEVVKVEDINEIISFGVMQTPGLALDGKVLSAGRLLTAAEIGDLLRKHGG